MCIYRIGSKMAVLQYNKRLRGLTGAFCYIYNRRCALENVRHNRNDRRASNYDEKALSLTICSRSTSDGKNRTLVGFDVHCEALWKDNYMPDDYRITFMLWKTIGRHKIPILWWGKSKKKRKEKRNTSGIINNSITHIWLSIYSLWDYLC